MNLQTHQALDRTLTGTPTELEPGRAVVSLTTTAAMAADAEGLVHGGFLFGLADHAAMLAINHPLVVLAGAEVRFLAPVAVGEEAVATARLVDGSGAVGEKSFVEATITCSGRSVFTGRFTCFVPERHVLERGDGGEDGSSDDSSEGAR